MDHYREADLGRFTRIGLISLVVLGVVGWFFYTHASREVRSDNRSPFERRGAAAAPAPEAPGAPDSLGDRIQNWIQGSGAPPATAPKSQPAPR